MQAATGGIERKIADTIKALRMHTSSTEQLDISNIGPEGTTPQDHADIGLVPSLFAFNGDTQRFNNVTLYSLFHVICLIPCRPHCGVSLS